MKPITVFGGGERDGNRKVKSIGKVLRTNRRYGIRGMGAFFAPRPLLQTLFFADAILSEGFYRLTPGMPCDNMTECRLACPESAQGFVRVQERCCVACDSASITGFSVTMMFLFLRGFSTTLSCFKLHRRVLLLSFISLICLKTTSAVYVQGSNGFTWFYMLWYNF